MHTNREVTRAHDVHVDEGAHAVYADVTCSERADERTPPCVRACVVYATYSSKKASVALASCWSSIKMVVINTTLNKHIYAVYR